MNDVLDAYTRLIKLIQRRTPEACSIFIHNYDYAYPDGRGVGSTAWIKPALVASKVPEGLHRDVVKYWIDQFTDVLKQAQMLYPARIHLVDGRGTLLKNEWANELHPTAAGFQKLAVQKWVPELIKVGL